MSDQEEQELCGVRWEVDYRSCTREKGHDGPHGDWTGVTWTDQDAVVVETDDG